MGSRCKMLLTHCILERICGSCLLITAMHLILARLLPIWCKSQHQYGTVIAASYFVSSIRHLKPTVTSKVIYLHSCRLGYRESGERRELPQQGPGQSPGQKRILTHFGSQNTSGSLGRHKKCNFFHSVMSKIDIFE